MNEWIDGLMRLMGILVLVAGSTTLTNTRGANILPKPPICPIPLEKTRCQTGSMISMSS